MVRGSAIKETGWRRGWRGPWESNPAELLRELHRAGVGQVVREGDHGEPHPLKGEGAVVFLAVEEDPRPGELPRGGADLELAPLEIAEHQHQREADIAHVTVPIADCAVVDLEASPAHLNAHALGEPCKG